MKPETFSQRVMLCPESINIGTKTLAEEGPMDVYICIIFFWSKYSCSGAAGVQEIQYFPGRTSFRQPQAGCS
jgi:hypothetical protein